jgi:cytochrome c oxidase cbb3-type subunit 2
MPGFPWLAENVLDPEEVQAKMRALRKIGVPYTDEEIDAAPAAVQNRTEMDALIAYMQSLKFRGADAKQQAAEVKFDAASAAARGQP